MNKRSLFVFFVFVFFFSVKLFAQKFDNTYVKQFDQAFAVRLYAFDKYTSFDKEFVKDESLDRIFKTNSPVSIGAGISWKGLSFSYSYGFNLFKDKKRGKTKSLEFQHHGSWRMFAYDVYLQQHKGFYDDMKNEDKSYNLLPDVKLSMYGGSLQYIFNNKKFSYQAAFNQSERQLKSAGSLLVGTTLYYSKVRSDSVALFTGMENVHKNLQIGLTVGYVFTWVINKRLFVTGSFTGGASMGNNYPTRFFKNKMRFYPTINGRFAMGYNAKTWSVGTSFQMNRVYLFFDGKENLGTSNGNLQLTFIKRFDWSKGDDKLSKTRKKLRVL